MAWTTILVPHDFSASANHATALARDEAKLRGATLVLLHVVDFSGQMVPDAMIVENEAGGPMSIRDYAISRAKMHLQDLVARLAKDGVTATGAVRAGNAAEQIEKFAGECRADVICVGGGATAERLVRRSSVPVLSVRATAGH